MSKYIINMNINTQVDIKIFSLPSKCKPFIIIYEEKNYNAAVFKIWHQKPVVTYMCADCVLTIGWPIKKEKYFTWVRFLLSNLLDIQHGMNGLWCRIVGSQSNMTPLGTLCIPTQVLWFRFCWVIWCHLTNTCSVWKTPTEENPVINLLNVRVVECL